MGIIESNLTPGYSTKVGGAPRNGITARQKLFIQEYLIDGDGKRAAAAAGYKNPGTMAARLTNREVFPMVADELERQMEKRNKECLVKHEQVVAELARVAFVNPKMLLDKDGVVIPLKDLPDDIAAAISEMTMQVIETEEEGVKETRVKTTVKFHDKLNALRQLSQVLGMVTKVKGNLGDNITNILQINWGDMLTPNTTKVDLIEQRIAEAEAEAKKSV